MMLILVLSQQTHGPQLWPFYREAPERRAALRRKQEEEPRRPEASRPGKDEPAVLLELRMDAGLYSLSGTMRADENGLESGDLDLVTDYGLQSNPFAYRGGAAWWWDHDRHHGLELSVFRLRAGGSRSLTDHLYFNHVDFRPGENIESELTFWDVRLGYVHLLGTPWNRLQIRGIAGLALDYFFMTLHSSNPIAGHKPETDEEFDTVSVFVGIQIDAPVSDSLAFRMRVEALWSTPLETDHGRIFSGEAAFEWKVSDRVSVALGYRRWQVHFELSGDEGGGDIADNRTTFQAAGPFFQIAFEW